MGKRLSALGSRLLVQIPDSLSGSFRNEPGESAFNFSPVGDLQFFPPGVAARFGTSMTRPMTTQHHRTSGVTKTTGIHHCIGG